MKEAPRRTPSPISASNRRHSALQEMYCFGEICLGTVFALHRHTASVCAHPQSAKGSLCPLPRIPALGFVRIVPALLRKQYYEMCHTHRATSKTFIVENIQ